MFRLTYLGTHCYRRHAHFALRRFSTKTQPYEGGSTVDSSAYCRDLVRKHDYEGFLVSQFYPNEVKDSYFAVKAFSVRHIAFGSNWLLTQVELPQIELAMVHDQVSNEMIGKMRMQFWRDAVKGITEVRITTYKIITSAQTVKEPTGQTSNSSRPT